MRSGLFDNLQMHIAYYQALIIRNSYLQKDENSTMHIAILA